jgi:hypothetical protein
MELVSKQNSSFRSLFLDFFTFLYILGSNEINFKSTRFETEDRIETEKKRTLEHSSAPRTQSLVKRHWVSILSCTQLSPVAVFLPIHFHYVQIRFAFFVLLLSTEA